jgi:hypothetical protein
MRTLLHKLLTTSDRECLTHLLCAVFSSSTAKRIARYFLDVLSPDACTLALAVYDVKCEALQLVTNFEAERNVTCSQVTLSFGECLQNLLGLFNDRPLVKSTSFYDESKRDEAESRDDRQ